MTRITYIKKVIIIPYLQVDYELKQLSKMPWNLIVVMSQGQQPNPKSSKP
jgi:hypothetical protein